MTDKIIGSGETAYTERDAVQLRDTIIGMRNEALTSGNMIRAVTLSHVIAFMANAIKEIWPT